MRQTTFASLAWNAKGRTTRRERFLAEMNAVVPWARLTALIEAHYPKGGSGRPLMAALGGWATTEAADRDDQYLNGDSYYYHHYHHHPKRHAYHSRHYRDHSYTYYYERDGRRHYSYYSQRPHRYGYDYYNYSYNGVDPYGIDRHDTN